MSSIIPELSLCKPYFSEHFIYGSMLFYGILWYHDKCNYTIIALLNVAEMIYCIILWKSTIAKSLINNSFQPSSLPEYFQAYDSQQ